MSQSWGGTDENTCELRALCQSWICARVEKELCFLLFITCSVAIASNSKHFFQEGRLGL